MWFVGMSRCRLQPSRAGMPEAGRYTCSGEFLSCACEDCFQGVYGAPNSNAAYGRQFDAAHRLRVPVSLTASSAQMMDVVELGRQRDAIVGLPGVNGLSVEKRKVGRHSVFLGGAAGLLCCCRTSAAANLLRKSLPPLVAPAPVLTRQECTPCLQSTLLRAAPHDCSGACGQPEHCFHGVSADAVLQFSRPVCCTAGSVSACQTLPESLNHRLTSLLPALPWRSEPTSGLDARAAAIIMRAVRRITSTGRCVVCTIHQPSWDVFKVGRRASWRQGAPVTGASWPPCFVVTDSASQPIN